MRKGFAVTPRSLYTWDDIMQVKLKDKTKRYPYSKAPA